MKFWQKSKSGGQGDTPKAKEAKPQGKDAEGKADKKNNGTDKADPKKAKGKKSKSAKANPQQLLAQHVEKLVVAGVAAVFLLLVYNGLGVDGLPRDHTPETLEERVQTASTRIDQDNSEEIVKKRQPELNFVAKVRAANHLTDARPYEVHQPLKPLPPARRTRRSDPNLYAPTKLEVVGVYGAVAEAKDASDIDRLAELEFAPAREPEEIEETPRPRDRDRRRRGRGEEYGYGYGYGEDYSMPDDYSMDYGYGMDYGMDYGMGGTGGGRQLDSKYTRGWFRPGGAGAAGYGMDYGMDYSMDYGSEYDDYGSMPGSPGGAQDRQRRQSRDPIARTRAFVAVNALFPMERQFEEFERVLRDSEGYNPAQDQPRIIRFQAQRVDVTDNPDRAIDESEWQVISHTGYVRNTLEPRWAATPPDIIPRLYQDPNCTMAIPPMLMADLRSIATHSELPMEEPRRMMPRPEEMEEEIEQLPDDPTIDDGPMRTDPRRRPGMASGAGMGYGMDYGAGMGYGMDYGAGMGYGMDYGGMGYGMDDYGMGYGAGMGMGRQARPPRYKLVRFFDFHNVEPNRKYRYRVRLYIEDPNRPEMESLAPSPQMLAPEVLERIRNLAANESENGRVFWRTTDWSEPSDAVEVRVPEEYYVGPITRANMIEAEIDGKRVEIPRNPTDVDQGKLVATVWGGRTPQRNQDTYPTHIPGERTVRHGSVLNFRTNAEVIHPLTWQIKLLEDFRFQTDAIVVDLRGGEVLPGADADDPLTAPAEIAVIDSDGNFVVRNEIDTMQRFRMFTFADEMEAARARPAAARPDQMMPGGYDEMPGQQRRRGR